MASTNHINVTTWNMKGLSGASPYAHELLDNCDICVLTEHHLYPCELYKLDQLHQDFDVYSRSSSMLDNSRISSIRGFGGIAVMWRSNIDHMISRCTDMGNYRIIVVKIEYPDGRKLYIIRVYLPQQNCYIDSFNSISDLLDSIIYRCSSQGEILIIGDTNCNFGPEIGPRGYGITTKNAKTLHRICTDNDMNIIDLSSHFCVGPMYTFYVEGVGQSYIDHCIISSQLSKCVVSCEVI